MPAPMTAPPMCDFTVPAYLDHRPPAGGRRAWPPCPRAECRLDAIKREFNLMPRPTETAAFQASTGPNLLITFHVCYWAVDSTWQNSAMGRIRRQVRANCRNWRV